MMFIFVDKYYNIQWNDIISLFFFFLIIWLFDYLNIWIFFVLREFKTMRQGSEKEKRRDEEGKGGGERRRWRVGGGVWDLGEGRRKEGVEDNGDMEGWGRAGIGGREGEQGKVGESGGEEGKRAKEGDGKGERIGWEEMGEDGKKDTPVFSLVSPPKLRRTAIRLAQINLLAYYNIK